MRLLKSNVGLIDSAINNNRGLSIIILQKAVFYLSVIETFYYNIIILETYYGRNENNSINICSFVWYNEKYSHDKMDYIT